MEARIWKPPWSLDLEVGVVWAGEHPYTTPSAVQAALSVSVNLALRTWPPRSLSAGASAELLTWRE